MVQKAVQQLLFDVDWRQRTGQETSAAEDSGGLDILVIDMPPGTGDVQLTLGQLVKVDGDVLFLPVSLVNIGASLLMLTITFQVP